MDAGEVPGGVPRELPGDALSARLDPGARPRETPRFAPSRESALTAPAVPSGFVALRTPLLPFVAFEGWSRGFSAARAPGDAAAWTRDTARARARLRALLDDPVVREAVWLASPSLDERTAAWRDDPDSENGRGVETGLVKYVSRMAVRCTPFGLFAGNTVGRIARDTRLALLDRGAAVRHTRLDMDFLFDVVERLAADAGVRERVPFAPNTSLYEAGGTLRYAEARKVSGRRAYFLVDVEPNEAIAVALERAKGGAKLPAIAAAIADDDIPLEAARGFVDELVEAQLLVPALGPVVTGPETLDDLIARLAASGAAGEARARLEAARDGLIDMDAEGPGVDPARYGALAAPLAELAPVEPSRFVQVDLVKPAAGVTVSADLVDELLRGVQALVDLLGQRTDPLAEFRRAFEERYGDREVPLVEALDEEIGIGFGAGQGPGADPSPLLAGLPFPAAEPEERVTWGGRVRFLEWKVAEAVASGAEEIVLTPAEVARFRAENAPALADAFAVMATLLTPDPRDPDAPRAVLDHAAGPSGVRLLGRFCHGDPELRAGVEAHLRQEEALEPDVRYFEIVHLPEGRTGNILARPLLREWELAYLGGSGAPAERTLRIDDLSIRLHRGRVLLRSRRLGCEVRPRLTSAHNTMWRSLGVYRFLSVLQSEGRVEGVMWAWGPLESQPRLPRVRFGRLVLSRATWNARKEELEALRRHTGHAAFRAVQEWRVRRGLPRLVGLVDSDNVLPLDLDNPLSVAAFVDELRGRDGIALQELLPGAGIAAAEAPEGRFTNEIVVPVVRPAVAAAAFASPAPAPAAPVRTGAASLRHAFPPGSEWLMAKLYAGPALADRVLTEVAAPLAESLRAAGAVTKWFFLRYGDPDWHLRLRLHGEPERLVREAIPALHAATDALVTDGRLHRVQLDTYVREVQRYGGDAAMEPCETLFHADSAAAAAFLADAAGDAGLDARWRFALVGMDRQLEDLGFDLAGRRTLMESLADMYGTEFRLDSALRQRLRERYREERRALEELLDARGDSAAALGAGYDLLRARTEAGREACAALRTLSAQGALAVPLADVAVSLLHMHANRVLRSANRAQEMVLYRFLEKTYASRLARSRATAEVAAS